MKTRERKCVPTQTKKEGKMVIKAEKKKMTHGIFWHAEIRWRRKGEVPGKKDEEGDAIMKE